MWSLCNLQILKVVTFIFIPFSLYKYDISGDTENVVYKNLKVIKFNHLATPTCSNTHSTINVANSVIVYNSYLTVTSTMSVLKVEANYYIYTEN